MAGFVDKGRDHEDGNSQNGDVDGDKTLARVNGTGDGQTQKSGNTNVLQFGNRNVSIPCLEFEKDGSHTEKEMTKAAILARARRSSGMPDPRMIAKCLDKDKDELDEFIIELGLSGNMQGRKKLLKKYLKTTLQVRDLRQVDPSFPQKPAIWVRQGAIIVSLEGVRSIIFHDSMLVFDPDNSTVKRCAQFIEETLVGSSVDDMFLPFELRALEGFLIFATTTLEVEFAAVSQEVLQSIVDPKKLLTTGFMEEMRLDKQKLSHFSSRADAVQSVLSELLDDDEDMSNMYLTEKHRHPGRPRNVLDHDEAEMLLESYLQVMDDLTNKARLLDHEIDDVEDVMAIHLDTLRNKLIMMQLLISVLGLGVTTGAMIAGLFGMNLPIPIFESDSSSWWFLGATLLILFTIVTIPTVVIRWLRNRNLYASLLR